MKRMLGDKSPRRTGAKRRRDLSPKLMVADALLQEYTWN